MRAIVQDEYGSADVLTLEELERPVVGPGQVLVRVHAASVNPADWHFMRGEPYVARLQAGLRRPKAAVLGCDLAGTVEAVGERAGGYAVGDEVFGCSFMRGFGAFAEFAAISTEVVSRKPATLSFAEAAAVPLAALTALQGIRDHGQVKTGKAVLIIGASGGVGTFAVQIAKARGAEVTGVCSSTNADLVRSLGADRVIDYASQDITESDERYDLIFQLGGSHAPGALRSLLNSKGTLLLSSGESTGRWIGPLGRVIKASLLSPFVSQSLVSFTVKPNSDDLDVIKELIDDGRVRPVIDRAFQLADVPDAIKQVERGHTQGKIVVNV